MATHEELRAQLQARHDKDVIAKAVAVLEARGCKYSITEPDGDHHTNIVADEKPPRVMVNDFVADTNYIEILSKIEKGQSDIVIVPEAKVSDHKYVENLRASVVGRCRRDWGEKTFKVEIGEGRNCINVMRNPDL